MRSGQCTSALYETSGPPLGGFFNPAQVQVRVVGTISFNFSSSAGGAMSYNVNGITGTKIIQRQPF